MTKTNANSSETESASQRTPHPATTSPQTNDAAQHDAVNTNTEEPRTIVTARGLGLVGDRGRVYGPIDLDISEGGLTVLRGHPGNGRTCMLLALAGRMRPTEGTLEVCGERKPQRIFKHAAIAGFRDIDRLDPAVTVRALLAEQRAWMAPFWRIRRPTTARDLEEILYPVFGDRPLPGLRTRVDDLAELDRMLLRIALAWSEGAELLIVDDLEQVRIESERVELARRLAYLGETATVIASAVDDLPAEAPEHQLITLPASKESRTKASKEGS